MLRKPIAALVVLAAAAAAIVWATRSGGTHTSPNAPVALTRPYLENAGARGDEVQVFPAQFNDWASPTGGSPHITLRYSWESCDLQGKSCSPLPGLRTQRIDPPQELHIVSLRAVVTASDRDGSRSVTTKPLYDMAGYPFPHLRFARTHLQFDPEQLRAWYGLSSDENGAGQTIVLVEPWRARDLRAAILGFSLHYGLARPCPSVGKSTCFKLAVFRPRGQPRYAAQREIDLDVEWAHAIAPRAAIDVLEADAPEGWISGTARRTGAHVFSSSFGWPDSLSLNDALPIFGLLARNCGTPRVVCVWGSGDNSRMGWAPSNSPAVLAIGGTKFRTTDDGTITGETAWPYSGGGTTRLPEPRPTWQKDLPCDPVSGDCTEREIPDVSGTAAAVPQFDVDPSRWTIGTGTSLAAPLWAGLLAVADQKLALNGQPAIGIDELHVVLYGGWLSAGLDDLGHSSWSRRTGWGAPKAGIVDVLVHAIERYRSQH